MLKAGLHAVGRNGPDLLFGVDFSPTHSERFIGSRSRQDGKFERQRPEALLFAKAPNKGGNIVIGHCSVMSARLLVALGEELIEVAAPAGGILSGPVSGGAGGVQHLLKPSAKSGSRSAFAVQIGRSTVKTSSVVMVSTGIRRNGAA